MAAGTRLWHPFAAMGQVDGHELVLVRGEGVRVWDEDGTEYLDATAGLWFANVGHGRAEIADAVGAQLRTLAAHNIFGDYANRPALDLAERVAVLAPLPDPAVFFGTGGAEAIDTAAKIVRRYWALMGQPDRTVIVSRRHAYHGTAAYGTSLSGIPAIRDGYGTLVGDVAEVAHDDPDDLARTLDGLGARAAAFIGEPMIGAGGAIPPPEGYWPAVERICRERGVLLVADEVISGFGRLGRWFGCERYGFTPDLMTCAKGITSGYVPLGAVVVSGTVRAPFWEEGAPPFLQGGTYSGHPGACVAGLANLDILEREALVDRVAELEPVLRELLEPLRDLDGVADVRSAGLAGAVELDPALLAASPGAPAAAVLEARRQGVLTRALRGVALQLSPPFIVAPDELEEIVAGVAAGVRAAAAAAPV
ncbi:MAG: aminotransferase class III-fold pyridoxal phosphate-dependent enzyme [Gaiellaceae bacterium]